MNTITIGSKNVTPYMNMFYQDLKRSSGASSEPENITEIKLYGIENISEVLIEVGHNTVLNFFSDEIKEGENILPLRELDALYTSLIPYQELRMGFVWNTERIIEKYNLPLKEETEDVIEEGEDVEVYVDDEYVILPRVIRRTVPTGKMAYDFSGISVPTPKIEVTYNTNTVPLTTIYDTPFQQYRGVENSVRKFRVNTLRYSHGAVGTVMM